MKRAPGVHRHGTAAQLAERTSGYSANGESSYTRESAHGKIKNPPTRITAGMPFAVQIEVTRNGLRRLETELMVEDNLKARQKINHQLSIKYQFLKRLQDEARNVEAL